MRTGWTEWYETSTDEAKRAELSRSGDVEGTGSAVR